MRILIEGHQYRAELVRDILADIQDSFDKKKDPVTVDYVGYFYNATLKDCVFLLPKVLLEDHGDEELAFGSHKPEDIINLIPGKENPLTEEQRRFIYNFAVWIYSAINVYNNTNPDNGIVEKQVVTQARRGRRHQTDTFLDVVLALIRFNRENQNFFFFVLRNLHSGYNKINWTRTISKSTAIIQDNRPVYLNPVNRKRQINFDEELLVIFFSILNYINTSYGFHVPINCNFDLIKGKQFDAYINKGLGRTRLLQIKYKYFSDKVLELWEMCYTFFDNAHLVNLRTSQMEYLIARNFNIVFEAMIDDLIGDKEMENMKEQEDGKIIDHIYKYKGLTIDDENKEIYYVGDSKYYKIGNKVRGKALYKQFTYARNITQWHLDLFRSNAEKDKAERQRYGNIKLRDELTEGYNIIPNFFISAMVNKKEGSNEMSFDYSNDKLTEEEWDKEKHMLTHFPNRLFDRDTLLVFHYNVNFLYVLALYARNNYMQKEGWRNKVREEFRHRIQNVLNDKFSFHAMKAKPGNHAGDYIVEHFHDVLGKVFTPFNDKNDDEGLNANDRSAYNGEIFSLALDREYVEKDKKLLDELRQHFYIPECRLGDDANEVIKREIVKDFDETIKQAATSQTGYTTNVGVLMVMMENYEKRSKNFLPNGKLAIGLKETRDSDEIKDNMNHIYYVLFHARSENTKHLFPIVGKCRIQNSDEIEEGRYRNVREAILYIAVDIDTSAELDASKLCVTNIPFTPATRYDAQCVTIEKLIVKSGNSTQYQDEI